MTLRPGRLPAAEIPAAPLAGIALVALLAAVVTGAHVEERGLHLSIAQGGGGPRLPWEDAFFVAVLPEGSLLVNGEPRTLREISSGAREPRRFVVGATDDTPYAAVVAVLDALASETASRSRDPEVLLPTRAEVAELAKRLGYDPFAARSPPR